jgi:hypothetical protein
MEEIRMPATTEVRSAIVLLEPKERPSFEAERSEVLAASATALAPGAEIRTPDEYTAVAELEARIDRFIDLTEPMFDRHCAEAHRVWKSACDIRTAFIGIPKQLKARARELLGAYKAREAKERREAERREAERQHAEETARIEAEAALLERQGHKEIAAAVREAPIDLPTVILPSTVPDVAGLTFREDWYWQPIGGDTPANRARAVSMMVKADVAPFLQLSDAGLTAYAKRTKGTIRVPGIEFKSRQIPVRR